MAKVKGTNGDDTLIGTAGPDHIDGKAGDDTIYALGGSDKVKGGKGSDTIFGDAGNDKLKGGDGDDHFNGGAGNDNIDGGKGTDTAHYSGMFSDYTISFESQGDHKGTVTDNRAASPDGTDTLKNVEYLEFANGRYNVNTGTADTWHYLVNADLDPSAQDPAHPGTMIAGSGIPATEFGIARNEGAGIELGLAIHHRSGPPANAAITSTDNYNDGVLHYQVAAGADPSNANRAEWNFDWSVASHLNGQPTNLDSFNFKLLIDTDPSANTNYLQFTMGSGGSSSADIHWTDQFAHVIMDDEGVPHQVAQNSENIVFFDPAYAPTFGPGHFDIVLEAHDLVDNHLLAQNHIVVDVV